MAQPQIQWGGNARIETYSLSFQRQGGKECGVIRRSPGRGVGEMWGELGDSVKSRRMLPRGPHRIRW